GGVTIGAIMAVNAFGDIVLPNSDIIIAGARSVETGEFVDTARTLRERGTAPRGIGKNTTIGVIATDASLSSEQINHLATVAQDGLARTIRPAHTMLDGDTVFGLATGKQRDDWRDSMVALAAATSEVVARAIVKAAALATPAGGLPAGVPPSE
ncbi:MAG TPA: P1 family peptidase, partial [Chloroflexota bacterium]